MNTNKIFIVAKILWASFAVLAIVLWVAGYKCAIDIWAVSMIFGIITLAHSIHEDNKRNGKAK